MKSINASIISIGDELLIGQVIDTNSAFMAKALNQAGIWVHRRAVVGDEWDEIWNALDEELAISDIVLLSGGLGPTSDDITKQLLARYFGGKLEEDATVLQHIKELFAGRELHPSILEQAKVPDNCRILPNKRGTAPAMWFEKGSHIAVALPGVPYEMQGIVTEELMPRLAKHFVLPPVYYRTLCTAGVGESQIYDRLKDFEDKLPNAIELAYLPDFSQVRLRLTVMDASVPGIDTILDESFSELKKLLSDIMYSDQDETLEEAIGKLLRRQKATVATAESCTAGNIAHTISKVPGASDYLLGGVVSYSNAIKHRVLKVKAETLKKYGAVSEQTVREMVDGVRKLMDADYAVAVSGILGPGGGTAEKPVGSVWIAAGNAHKTVAKLFHFRNDRERNMRQTTTNALNQLRLLIEEDASITAE